VRGVGWQRAEGRLLHSDRDRDFDAFELHLGPHLGLRSYPAIWDLRPSKQTFKPIDALVQADCGSQ
jgi:hypothetical protein